MASSRPNLAQIERLVEFLEQNIGIARGILRTTQAKMETKKKWESLAPVINALGTANKNGQGWAKYWAEKKCGLKKQWALIHSENLRTGGLDDSISRLSELDQRLITVMGVQELNTGDSEIHSFSDKDVQVETNTSLHISSLMPSLLRNVSSSPLLGADEEVGNADRKPFSEQSSDEDSGYLDLENDLWGLFDEWAHGRAQCTMCKAVLRKRSQVLTRHLKETHTTVFEHLQSGNAGNFTETIYIEDAITESEPAVKKPKFSSKLNFKPKLLKEPFQVHNDLEQTESFVRYIADLLRDVPEEACAKLQMDIVKLIVDAKSNALAKERLARPDNVGQGAKDSNQENQLEHSELDACEYVQIEIQNEPDIPKFPKKRPKNTNKMSTETRKDKAIETESFEKYVTSLLKTIPNKETEMKLQMDIINVIMRARLKVLSNSAPNSFNSIDNRRVL